MGKLMFKMHNETLFGYKQVLNLRKLHKHDTQLSAKSNYSIQSIPSNLGKRLFAYAGLLVWKDVPDDLKSASIYRFKKGFRYCLLKQYKEQ